MKRKVRVGSRDSKLAVIQAEMVMDSIKRFDHEMELELVTMKTTGDKILDQTLDKIGGKGLFVKELEQALLDGRIDLCVHSFKDMQIEENSLLPIVALGKREDARDVQIDSRCSKRNVERIGSSSARRAVQLHEMNPSIPVEPIRGNVLTRLEKLDRGEFSSIVLAYAGIKRLGLEKRVSRIFSIEEIVPAACQGILAVQGRKGENYDYLQPFNQESSWFGSDAEREFVKTLDCGCHSPVGAYAEESGRELQLTGFYFNKETGQIHRGVMVGSVSQARQLGEALARRCQRE